MIYGKKDNEITHCSHDSHLYSVGVSAVIFCVIGFGVIHGYFKAYMPNADVSVGLLILYAILVIVLSIVGFILVEHSPVSTDDKERLSELLEQFGPQSTELPVSNNMNNKSLRILCVNLNKEIEERRVNRIANELDNALDSIRKVQQ